MSVCAAVGRACVRGCRGGGNHCREVGRSARFCCVGGRVNLLFPFGRKKGVVVFRKMKNGVVVPGRCFGGEIKEVRG
jgi:hypothetical protein